MITFFKDESIISKENILKQERKLWKFLHRFKVIWHLKLFFFATTPTSVELSIGFFRLLVLPSQLVQMWIIIRYQVFFETNTNDSFTGKKQIEGAQIVPTSLVNCIEVFHSLLWMLKIFWVFFKNFYSS